MGGRAGTDYYETIMTENLLDSARECIDLSSWNRLQRLQKSDPAAGDTRVRMGHVTLRSDCPLDKAELGRNTWSFLHTMAASYSDAPTLQEQNDMVNFFNILSRLYPCESCAEHFRKQLKVSAPLVESQEELKEWLCWIHNNVNRRLGKPMFDCKLVNDRWTQGWKSGSCNKGASVKTLNYRKN